MITRSRIRFARIGGVGNPAGMNDSLSGLAQFRVLALWKGSNYCSDIEFMADAHCALVSAVSNSVNCHRYRW